jgi:hypothetical protein
LNRSSRHGGKDCHWVIAEDFTWHLRQEKSGQTDLVASHSERAMEILVFGKKSAMVRNYSNGKGTS